MELVTRDIRVIAISPMVTMATLVLRFLFGAVLSYTYARLAGQVHVATAT